MRWYWMICRQLPGSDWHGTQDICRVELRWKYFVFVARNLHSSCIQMKIQILSRMFRKSWNRPMERLHVFTNCPSLQSVLLKCKQLLMKDLPKTILSQCKYQHSGMLVQCSFRVHGIPSSHSYNKLLSFELTLNRLQRGWYEYSVFWIEHNPGSSLYPNWAIYMLSCAACFLCLHREYAYFTDFHACGSVRGFNNSCRFT